ncbi:protein kinase [Lyngbya sp. CCY1209]|uniref:protein kinase domain-containing protein n=1 Tax=Lyngbya sp. CCY1209 TaxID=2886103 RepID=UPI002D204374|nr:protein kinase [Lyngbya sp. CCY1209]MEB3882003.1 protein kinase [Lyngbya sp. CCY1209]
MASTQKLAEKTTMNQQKRVVDQLGTVYQLSQKLGQGGQGVVYAVEGGRRAVKILNKTSQTERDRLRRQLQLVQQLDLKGLNIARPLEMLKPPRVGYVMELLTDMMPISKLSNYPQNVNCIVEWYLEGGGLKRRLLLLAQCAETLSQLHGKGLVYSDPSENNVFVSCDVNHHIIRLIDADNLHYQSNHSTSGVYTPRYGAPELVNGKSGVNTLTDAYAFAVIAFQTLSLVHPLIGDLVNEGEPELEQEALEGQLPWIDHPEDRRNSTQTGFPRKIVLSPQLQELCQRCFGEGLLQPQKRPGLGQWVEALYSASDNTLHCPNCQSTYYWNQKICPWCEHPRPRFVQVLIQRWHPEANPKRFDEIKNILQVMTLEKDRPLILTRRTLDGRIGMDGHTPELELIFDGNNIKVKSLSDRCFWLTSEGEGAHQIKVEVKQEWRSFPANPDKYKSWLLHFYSLNTAHRLAYFSLA